MKLNSLTFYACIAAMQVCWCGGLAAQIDISGNIRTESGNNINEVAVTLTGPGVTLYDFSDENGNYQFTGVPENQDYSICLDMDNPLNGVSGLDRLLIRNHVNTTMPFTSPYTIVAADATGDGVVNMRDVYRIKQMFLLV